MKCVIIAVMLLGAELSKIVSAHTGEPLGSSAVNGDGGGEVSMKTESSTPSFNNDLVTRPTAPVTRETAVEVVHAVSPSQTPRIQSSPSLHMTESHQDGKTIISLSPDNSSDDSPAVEGPVSCRPSTLPFPLIAQSRPPSGSDVSNEMVTQQASLDRPSSTNEYPIVVDLPLSVGCEILNFFDNESLVQVPRNQQRWKFVGSAQTESLSLISKIVDLLVECLQAHVRLIKKVNFGSSGSHVDGGGTTPSFVMLHRVAKLIAVALHSTVITLSKHCEPVLKWSNFNRSASVLDVCSPRMKRKQIIDLRLFRQLGALLSINGIPMTDEPKRDFSQALHSLALSLFVPELPDLAPSNFVPLQPVSAQLIGTSANSTDAPAVAPPSASGEGQPVFDFNALCQRAMGSKSAVTALVKIRFGMDDQFTVLAARVEFITRSTVRILGLHPSIQTTINASILRTLLKTSRDPEAVRREKSNTDGNKRKRTNPNENESTRKRQKKGTESSS